MIGFSQTLSAAQKNKTIKIGISTSFPPFNYLNENGKISGYNADIAMAVCRKIKAHCEFTLLPFPQVIPALEANEIQLAASNLLRTEERAKRINFSAKYYRSTSSLLGHMDNSTQKPVEVIKNPDTSIAVTAGSTQWRYLSDHAKGEILVKASIGETMLALQKSQVDYILIPTLFALNFLERPENDNLDFVGLPLEEKTLSGDVHLGITKADPELKIQVDQAIQALVNSGELRALSKKYFPFNVY
ncbi:substrate-binding periplasmic protein [Oceanospirillum linum]|uniref:substrate-binding periplasmic protein n=1 Tax=Oceanospirillum linum TaxID=966 RepID=UPI00135C1136|nr:transporter substrate-binding domain-containing protein [Oceanospirillum linum]